MMPSYSTHFAAAANRMNLSALLSPVPIALGLLVILFITAVLIQGGFGKHKDEARFGLESLCKLRWNDFARIVGAALKDHRGMAISGLDRSPGKGGFDLLFQRGATKYLVQCKNSTTQKVTAQMVGELNSLMQTNDAEGAIITSCGPAEARAVTLAQERHIDLIAGASLWSFLSKHVPHDVLEAAQGYSTKRRMVRFGISGGLALIACLLCLTLWPSPPVVERPQAAVMSPPAVPVATAPEAAATPITTVTAKAPDSGTPIAKPPGVVDGTLSEDHLALRRTRVEEEVQTLPQVVSAGWQTQSTLLLRLSRETSNETADIDKLAEAACVFLLKREELRYSRLQLEFPPANPDEMPQTRWRQCR